MSEKIIIKVIENGPLRYQVSIQFVLMVKLLSVRMRSTCAVAVIARKRLFATEAM